MKIVDVRFQASYAVGDTQALSSGLPAFLAVYPHGTTHARRRSTSSPARTEIRRKSTDVSPESPHLSPLRCSSPDPELDVTRDEPENYIGIRQMPYYSGRPPATPLQLMPLSSKLSAVLSPFDQMLYSRSEFCMKVTGLPDALVADDKEVNRMEARHVVLGLLKSLISDLPVCDTNEHESHSSTSAEKYHDMGVQVKPSNTMFKKDNVQLTDECNESEGEEENNSVSEWLSGVRALRDSHVRLVIRQLRQLKYIEKIDRALQRMNVAGTTQPLA